MASAVVIGRDDASLRGAFVAFEPRMSDDDIARTTNALRCVRGVVAVDEDVPALLKALDGHPAGPSPRRRYEDVSGRIEALISRGYDVHVTYGRQFSVRLCRGADDFQGASIEQALDAAYRAASTPQG